MPLLADEEILQLVKQGAVKHVPEPLDWFSSESAVQPASIDLRIGEIYLPGTSPGKRGSEQNPLREFVLRAGHTAIVATREVVELPADVAGVGFPPSHVSFKGLLMTNPGHVDPGYVGRLHFTLINMGRRPFVLSSGTRIMTLLLFRLDRPVKADYSARNAPKPVATSLQENLDRLSVDFLNFQNRAEKVARRVTKTAELRTKRWQLLWSTLAGLITFGAAFGVVSVMKEVFDARGRTQVLEERLQQQSRVDELARRVSVLETRVGIQTNDPGSVTR